MIILEYDRYVGMSHLSKANNSLMGSILHHEKTHMKKQQKHDHSVARAVSFF